MAHPSTSASLTNPKFDAWLVNRLAMAKALQRETRPQDLLTIFPMHLIPFVTYDDKEPIRVRISWPAQPEVRGILKIMGQIHQPRVFLISSAFNKQPREVPANAVIERYLPFKSKRWRRPKEYHKDVEAIYTLRYR